MKLNEIKLLEMPEDFLADPDQVMDWLEKHDIKSVRNGGMYSLVRVNRDGSVDILKSKAHGRDYLIFRGSTLLLGKNHLPIKLNEIGDLDIYFAHALIKNFKGLPNKMEGGITVMNASINSMEGLPAELNNLHFNDCEKISLCGINDYLKKFVGNNSGSKFIIKNTEITSGGLGLLLIDGLNDISFKNNGFEAERALHIISKYFGRPEDMYECQAELIDNDLEEFAKL